MRTVRPFHLLTSAHVTIPYSNGPAIFGLDDLRMFTRPRFRNGTDAIQETVHIYCDAKTLAVLEERFP